jgi:putative transposase
VQIAGMVREPNERWMNRMTRNLSDPQGGFLRSSRYLIHSQATVFREPFLETFRPAKVAALRLPARSPNLNTFAERFVRTIREDYLDRLILFGEASPARAVREFVLYFNRE